MASFVVLGKNGQLHSGSKRLVLEVIHVSLAYLYISQASHMAKDDVNKVGVVGENHKEGTWSIWQVSNAVQSPMVSLSAS